jgi:hypothetical protein
MLKGLFAFKKKDVGGTGRKLHIVVCTAHIQFGRMWIHTRQLRPHVTIAYTDDLRQ